MHEPLSDNITPDDREPTAGGDRRSAPSVEREVRLEGAPSLTEVIRARIADGFYGEPSVADVVARQIIASGELS